MTVSVTMLVTRMGEDGTLWESGTSHDATENFAKHLVQHQWATAEFGGTTGFTTARAFVTADDQYQLLDHQGAVLAITEDYPVIDLLPNLTLTDTVATEQQMAFATIPGGRFGLRSRLEVNITGQCAGASATKSVGFKAGPASGTMASATVFGGTGGLTAQYVGVKGLIWGNGVLGSQRASPSGPINWGNSNAASIVTLAIDTELDWNIYVYFTAGSTGGTNSFVLRSFWAQWVG